MTLPKDPKARKETPIFRGLFCYFPDALAEVARVSFVGNEQHNPGEPMHWAKEKSTDEPDAMLRHMLDEAAEPGGKDTDGLRHLAKVAWRALAQLQRAIEAEAGDIQAASPWPPPAPKPPPVPDVVPTGSESEWISAEALSGLLSVGEAVEARHRDHTPWLPGVIEDVNAADLKAPYHVRYAGALYWKSPVNVRVRK